MFKYFGAIDNANAQDSNTSIRIAVHCPALANFSPSVHLKPSFRYICYLSQEIIDGYKIYCFGT